MAILNRKLLQYFLVYYKGFIFIYRVNSVLICDSLAVYKPPLLCSFFPKVVLPAIAGYIAKDAVNKLQEVYA